MSVPRDDAAAKPALRLAVWLPVLLAVLAFYTRDAYAYPAPSGLATVWVGHACMLACLAATWDDVRRWRDRVLWATTLAALAVVAVTGILVGVDPLRAAWMGVANLVTALLSFGLFRFRGIGGSWLPRSAPEATWLMLAVFLPLPVGAVLGAFPGVPFGGGGDPSLFVWAVARYFASATVVVNCWLPLLLAPPRDYVRSRRQHVVPYVLFGLPWLAAPFLCPGPRRRGWP